MKDFVQWTTTFVNTDVAVDSVLWLFSSRNLLLYKIFELGSIFIVARENAYSTIWKVAKCFKGINMDSVRLDEIESILWIVP